MTISIELSFGSNVNKQFLLELQEHLQNEIEGLKFSYKEVAPLPGQMGSASIDLMSTMIYATTVAAIEVSVHTTLESLIESYIHKVKKAAKEFAGKEDAELPEISGIARSGKIAMSFDTSDSAPKILHKHPYSIDPVKTIVVLCGCSKYLQLDIQEIPPVENNLKALYDIMTDHRHFGIPVSNITVLLNNSYEDITEQLYQASQSEGIETFIFYYTGHGFSPGRNAYYLAAFNTRKRKDFINLGIDKDFIAKEILKASPAKQKIAIIDACYSGIMAQDGEPDSPFDKEVIGSYILTSSTADQRSFFNENEPFTHFTGALIDTIKNGVASDTETISLDDIYSSTTAKLEKKHYQLPTYNNGLYENGKKLHPSQFIVGPNVAYSAEEQQQRELARLEELIAHGMHEDAKYLLLQIATKYPEMKDIQDRAFKYTNEVMFSELVEMGDKYYFQEKDPSKAKNYYERALKLSEDANIRKKLNKCIALINHKKTVPQEISERKKKYISAALAFVSILIAIIIAKTITHKTKEKENASSLPPHPIQEVAPTPLHALAAPASSETPSQLLHSQPATTSAIAIPTKNITIGTGTLKEADQDYDLEDFASAAAIYIRNEHALSVRQLLRLAGMYEDKQIDDVDENVNYTKAMDLYLRASQKGSAEAMYHVGLFFHNGTVVPQNYHTALKWFLRSANAGNADAMEMVGDYYFEDGNGDYGVTTDNAKAKLWYKRALSKGNKNVLSNLETIKDMKEE